MSDVPDGDDDLNRPDPEATRRDAWISVLINSTGRTRRRDLPRPVYTTVQRTRRKREISTGGGWLAGWLVCLVFRFRDPDVCRQIRLCCFCFFLSVEGVIVSFIRVATSRRELFFQSCRIFCRISLTTLPALH